MRKNIDVFDFIGFALKLGFPLTLIILPLAIIFGSVSHWAPATEKLSEYSADRPITVGIGYHNTNGTKIVSRTYVLLPSAFWSPKTITIEQTNQDIPVVTENALGFLFLVTWCIASIFGTWWFWIRRKAR